ncbi:MAG: peptidase S11 [Candidatus Thorarchaeota archaeon]|nr:MAG: peptidase S11 [Candidatus Thorarchaeota archaeon]
MWKYLALCACFIIAGLAHAEPTLNAKHAIVVNLETGEVVLSKNEIEAVPIASITKLMTALVIADSNLDMTEEIEITREDLKNTNESTRTVGLFPGNTFTREELLLVALMSSSNRAAAALARTHPVGYEGFIELMNQKAAELGMYNTRYVDPTGLYNDNKSTAEDLVKLMRAVIARPMIGRFSTEVVYKKETTVTKRWKQYFKSKKDGKTLYRWVTSNQNITRYFGTTNRLLLTDDWNIYLQKTGFIRAAGYCLTMVVNINGDNHAIVLLNTTNQKVRAIDAIKAKYWVEYHVVPTTKTLASLSAYRLVNKR